jgi:hypothetical protein
MGADPNVVATIEQATDALLPVVVDLGACSYEAQLFLIERAGEPRVVLHPIAAQALPLNHDALFTLRAATSSQSWSVRCTDIVAAGPTHAAIGLRGMRFSRPDEAADTLSASDFLVLVVPGGLNDGIDHVFPVARIGQDSCEIRTSAGLTEGAVLPLVEIVGDRRLLRTAAAQVTRTTPWYGTDGARGFTCTLALSTAARVESEDGEQQHDLVTEPGEVKRLLRIAAMRGTQVRLEPPGHPIVQGALVELKSDHALVDLAPGTDSSAVSATRSLRVSFEMFAVAYELDVRPIELKSARLTLSLPLILRRRRRHRRDARNTVPQSFGVELRYRHPITGFVAAHRVTALSFYGVSFQIAAHGNVLWQGMPLEQAQLIWGERVVHLGDALVDGMSTGDRGPECRALMQDSRLVDDYDLIDLIGALANPELSVHDGTHFAQLHQTYQRAGLFGPHMDRNLAPIFDETAVNWRSMHAGARDMIRTFVNGPKEAPDAAVTAMRAWEACWLLQHFVDASSERFGATGKLQFAYIDHVLPRPDGRYIIFFVKADNAVMNAYFNKFFETTGTAEALSCTTVDLWIRRTPEQTVIELDPAISVEPCTSKDEETVSNAARRELGSHAAAAVSMLPGQLTLPDTTERFGRAGLVRTRDCVLVKRAGRIAYAVLEERSSPGINLTWMLNAAWIIPVHPELDDDGHALACALQTIVQRPAQSATGERFLNLPPNMNEAELERHGFEREARLNFYALNRAGVHRFFHYNVARYGEVEAMLMRRGRKKRD